MSILKFRLSIGWSVILISALPHAVAATEAWGELDCQIVEDFTALKIEQQQQQRHDLDLLTLTLRGTDHAAFQRIERQLQGFDNAVRTTQDDNGVTRRMILLVRDRCHRP